MACVQVTTRNGLLQILGKVVDRGRDLPRFSRKRHETQVLPAVARQPGLTSFDIPQQSPRFINQSLNLLPLFAASFVNTPRLSAFLFFFGAPDPAAPPCVRHRLLPCTAGDRQDPPVPTFLRAWSGKEGPHK